MQSVFKQITASLNLPVIEQERYRLSEISEESTQHGPGPFDPLVPMQADK